MAAVIKRNENFGKTMDAIMEQAVKTNAPVFCTVEGHGDIVVMPADAYADLLDETQTVKPADTSVELFDDDTGK
jgi:PHD/YefM family antitoxin component YafN of YafNO toxin-antitoxin module